MSWQDVVFLGGNLVFFAALVPALRSEQKPPRSTCLLTAVMLAVYAAAFGTLGLYLAWIGSALVSLTWAVLFCQRRREDDP